MATCFRNIQLAIQIQRNDILIAGLNVSQSDKYPPALEAIAIQLGYKKQLSSTVTELLGDIANKLESEK
jgi:hypothetical protein